MGLLDLRTALLGWSSLLLVAAADGLAAVVCVRWSRCEDGGVALASLVSAGEGIWLLNLQRGRLVRVVCAAERGGWLREGRLFLYLREGKDRRCLAWRESRDEDVLSDLFLFSGLGRRLLLGFG